MTTQRHSKHANIRKPVGGKIHRNEIALLGAPCGIIQQLSEQVAGQMRDLKIGYLDAAHGNDEPKGVFHQSYTDKIDFHQVHYQSDHAEYEFRELFNDCDLVLVNGNHFKAEKQLVIINEKKKESLERKLDRLTCVIGAILDEGQTGLHNFLQKDFSEVPLFNLQDVDSIVSCIREGIRETPVKGLVLAGGKSTRMGTDKGALDYHGRPQREHMANLLSGFCAETYISTNEDIKSEFPVLPDTFKDLGPYGGVLSAFRHDPNAAWLVVATDIPLLDEKTLALLTDHRNRSKVATCFHNPATSFPEPLITLWEPRAYPRLLYFLSMGYSCPRKVLINSEVEELEIANEDILKNANTPEEKQEMMDKIREVTAQ